MQKAGPHSQHISKNTWGKWSRKACDYCKRRACIICKQHFILLDCLVKLVVRCFWNMSFVSPFLFIGTHFQMQISCPLAQGVHISSKASMSASTCMCICCLGSAFFFILNISLNCFVGLAGYKFGSYTCGIVQGNKEGEWLNLQCHRRTVCANGIFVHELSVVCRMELQEASVQPCPNLQICATWFDPRNAGKFTWQKCN